jgi:ABC-type multidrug transport system fused ATPase/permease subunit
LGNLKSILKHFARYRRAVIIGVLSLLFVDGLQLLIPRIIKKMPWIISRPAQQPAAGSR